MSNLKVSAVNADFPKLAELLTLRGIPNSRTEDNVTFAEHV